MVKECKSRKIVCLVSENAERESIELLRGWVDKLPHLPAGISDKELLHFLHCSHYRVEQAKKVLDAYYSIRTNTEFFSGRNFQCQEFKRATDNMYFFQFQETTKHGEKILFFKLVSPDPAVFDYIETTRYGFATLDVYLDKNDRQPGYQAIFDMEGLSLGHVLKLSAHLSLVKKEVMYVQEALPFNLTAIHMLNTLPIVESLMGLLKPMMNSELLDMLCFYKPDETHLIFDVIPQDIFPTEYGGTAESVLEQTQNARKTLINAEKLLKHKETQIVNEALRVDSSPTSDLIGVSGSFKKLDLD